MKPARSSRSDWCEGHYYQRRRGQEMRPLAPRNSGAECAIEGCEKLRTGRYCSMHAARIRRHGDPHTVIESADRNMPRGERHQRWTETPSYTAIHQRLRKERGSATSYLCAMGCGSPAKQWACVSPRRPGDTLPWAESVDLYSPLCVRCHKHFDLAWINSTEEVEQHG